MYLFGIECNSAGLQGGALESSAYSCSREVGRVSRLAGFVVLSSLWERGQTTDSNSNVSTNLLSSFLTILLTVFLGLELAVLARIGDTLGGFLITSCNNFCL